MRLFDRRVFLATSSALLGSSLRFGKQYPDPRRLLFNWDGSLIHCFGQAALGSPNGPLSREQFVSLVFGGLAPTVDAIMFSFGSGNVAEYQSNVLE